MRISDVGRMLLVTHQPGDEQFSYDVPGYPPIIWNITIAKQLVTDPGNIIATVPIERSELEGIRDRNEWQEDKIASADPSVPGIGAPIVYQGKLFYILIDGTHRAVRAAGDGKPFYARLLTDEASRYCLITGPPPLMPWTHRV